MYKLVLVHAEVTASALLLLDMHTRIANATLSSVASFACFYPCTFLGISSYLLVSSLRLNK